MKNILLLMSAMSVLGGCSVAGSLAGELETMEMSAPAWYDSIEVSGGISVIWTQDVSTVSVTADVAVLPYVRVEESEGTLEIYIKDSYRFVKGTGNVSVCLPANDRLDEVELSGASSFVSEKPLYASSFSVDASGASSFKADIFAHDEISIELSGAAEAVSSLKAYSVEVDAGGASSAKLSGEAESMSVEASGASTVSSRNKRISAGKVRCSVSGASCLYVNCTSRIVGTASGASDVHYGNPGAVSDVSSSGASTVSAD